MNDFVSYIRFMENNDYSRTFVVAFRNTNPSVKYPATRELVDILYKNFS
jgi:hypothetical protein